MSLPTISKTWICAQKPKAEITPETFVLEERPIPELKDGEILVKTEYFSNDPAQRTWIQKGLDPARAYGPYIEEGEPMPAIVLGRVLASKSKLFEVGSRAQAFSSWQEYPVLSETRAQKIEDLEGLSPSVGISLLGVPTLTALAGLNDVGAVKASDTILVSGAAGATGSSVVQIAKNVIGCKRVIGIAGGEAKCDWVQSLGADVCLDYRSPDFEAELAKATEGGVDVYWDNVGGKILNSVLGKMSRHGQIIACGAIATYNDSSVTQISAWFEIISMRLTVKGFIILDWMAKFGEMTQQLSQYIKDGKIQAVDYEKVVPTQFEDVPSTWQLLFKGDGSSKQGKLVTKVI